jgi:hypothetical protein
VFGFRPGLRRALGLVVALAAAPLLVHAGPAAAGGAAHAAFSPTAAKPGAMARVTGVMSACPMTVITVAQSYTQGDGSRVQTPQPTPGMTDATGKFSVLVTVPAMAARSDILRPFAGWQYDTAIVSFQNCGGRVIGANLNVLPVNKAEHISLSSTRPRSGSTLHVTVTHCVGGVLPAFTQVIDRTGEYFLISKSSYSGTTWKGSVSLKHGYYGLQAPAGAAHASPHGARDAWLAVPCTQSKGPRRVALADHLQHVTIARDISIRRHG